jgi:hypothetical protein
VGSNAQLYMRGVQILDGILGDLEESFGMLSNATEMIVSGTSAGGLASYLHSGATIQRAPPRAPRAFAHCSLRRAGYIKSLLRASARVVAAPDAGFFLDAFSYERYVLAALAYSALPSGCLLFSYEAAYGQSCLFVGALMARVVCLFNVFGLFV